MVPESYHLNPFLRLLWPLVAGIVCADLFPCQVSGWLWLAVPLLPGAAWLVTERIYTRWLFGVTVCVAMFMTGFLQMSSGLARTEADFPADASGYEVRLDSYPQEKRRSWQLQATLLARTDSTGAFCPSVSRRLLLYFPKDTLAASLSRGDILRIRARLAPPVRLDSLSGFDYPRYLRRRGIAATGYVPRRAWVKTGHDSLRSLREQALDAREVVVNHFRDLRLQGDELAVLSALTVGDKSELSDELRETYAVAGVSHVLALSGLHVGLVYALVWGLFAFCRRRWPFLKPLLLLVALASLWGFAFLTGLSASVVRAVLMCSLLLLSTLQYEPRLPLNILSAAAFFMLLCCPEWLFDVGFQLSFVAVASIVLLHPRLMRRCPFRHWLPRKLWAMFSVSITVQLGTAPLVLFYFSRFPTHFLLTNLLVVPWVSLILYASVLLLLLTPFPVLQQAFAPVVGWMIRMQNNFLHAVERFPLATIDNWHIDGIELFLSYLSLILLWRSDLLSIGRRFLFFLASLLLLVLYHLWGWG